MMRVYLSAFALALSLAAPTTLWAQDDWTPAQGGVPPEQEQPLYLPDEDPETGGIGITGTGTATDEPDESGYELPDWLILDAEYRMRLQYVNPLDLSGTQVRSMDWTEHRARIRLGFTRDWMSINARFDLLDQVLWGDNGRFGTVPEPNSGVSVATNQPNSTGLGVGLPEGADPLDQDSYIPVLTSANPFEIDLLYIDVALPFGLLRVGRQPNLGQSVGIHDGERGNRWGVASFRDAGDRILFATKLDEAVRMIRSGGDHEINPSQDEGVIWASWYELADQGRMDEAGDNLRQLGTSVIWAVPEFRLGNTQGRDFALTTAFVNVAGGNFQTNVWAFPLSVVSELGDFRFNLAASFLRGETIEVSEGFAELNRIPATIQDVRANGARAVIDWMLGRVMLTAEVDYASGDPDPRSETPITSFSMPRDLNIGLLLFEQVLAYESARSAGVGIENLRNLNADSFPLTEVATEGRFTNAFALFPQILVDWVDTYENRFHTRFGVLMAWPDSGGAVDPVHTTLNYDGSEITDDAVNYHGGDPGSYYGTELDLQLGWTFRERFLWTVESAILFPGSALEDENGDAVNAFFLENRFELLF